MTSNQIRQQFLDFFRAKQHDIVPSSPVVPHDDPTLMFANAGMNQFKPIFLGTVDRNSAFGRMKRAANTQKCIRAGGKHNDLDDVGQDTYHHTFFEMLGNWSFGDYFKKEAIEWAWELLTEVYKIDKTRLHATYFEGDTAEGLEPDSEAAELWRTVTDINPSHIHPGNKKDNFWEMGDTGPCGPCSEIHIDLTPDKSGGHLVNAGDARVMEIWNLVFIQFNRGPDGKLSPLPAKHVDTGMGFERLCAVLQGMERNKSGRGDHAHQFSNYDTDVFTPIFDAIQRRTGAPKYTATLPSQGGDDARAASASGRSDQYRDREGGSTKATERQSDEATKHADQSSIVNRQSQISDLKFQIMIDVSYRVIADHVRCLTFALTDGAIPSNEGRGYVLRRILRRAVRYGRQYLNMHEPFLCDLVEPLVNHMGDVFPELRTGMNPKRPIDNVKHVADILRDEEASFLKTLDRGIKLFNEAAEYAQRHHHGKISGEDAFKLHDTYGFPIDLTELMAEEQGMSIDIGEYERLMDEAREKARTTKTAGHNADYSRIPAELLRSRAERTGFVGYGKRQSWARIIGILGQAQPTEFVLNIKEGDAAFLVLDRSPFYGEKGGQVGDVGHIYTSTGEFLVEDTQNFDGIIIHTGRCVSGRIMECNPKFGGWVGEHRVPEELYGPGSSYMEYAIARVGDDTRLPTMQNHTATHLLNWALREVLCPAEEREHPHVQQKGSLVDPEKTRFDFSHNHPLSEVELHKVESLVNEHIHAGLTVYTNNNVEVDQAAAREITGLRAVFGEKYPDRVRVVSIGVPVGDEDVSKDRIDKSKSLLGNPNNPEWLKYSVEFCGGTHVSNTKEIEAFVLTEETGVAKGVRRVVGVSGKAAQDAIARGKQLLKELEALAGKPPVARGDLASRVAAFQEKLNKCETPIPISVRHTIRERLTELQKIVKEQGKASAAESGEAVMQRVAAMFKIAGAEPLRSLASGWGKVLGAPCGGAADVGSECCRVIAGVVVVVGEVPAANPDALRGAIDWVRNKADASAVLLAYVDDGKVTLMAGMSKDVVGRGVKAGDLIKEIAPLVGGKGGGRPDMAQGGGGDPGGLQNALAKASAWIAAKLG